MANLKDEDGNEYTWDWLSTVDYLIIGGGIVGMYAAWYILNHTKKQVAVLNKTASIFSLLSPMHYGAIISEKAPAHFIRDGLALDWLKKYGKFEETDEKTFYDELFGKRECKLYKPVNDWAEICHGIMKDISKSDTFWIQNNCPIYEGWLKDILYKTPGTALIATPEFFIDKESQVAIVSHKEENALQYITRKDALTLSKLCDMPIESQVANELFITKSQELPNRAIALADYSTYKDISTLIDEAHTTLSLLNLS